LLVSLSSKFGDDTTSVNYEAPINSNTHSHNSSGSDPKRAKLNTNVPSIENQKYLFVSNLCEDENEVFNSILNNI
jgi:hypothetical protein